MNHSTRGPSQVLRGGRPFSLRSAPVTVVTLPESFAQLFLPVNGYCTVTQPHLNSPSGMKRRTRCHRRFLVEVRGGTHVKKKIDEPQESQGSTMPKNQTSP